ncbi:MAG: glycosyltransferase family 39 protein [Janthinobacterium lividum]
MMDTATGRVATPFVHTNRPRQQLGTTDWLVLLFTLLVVALVCLAQSTVKPFWYDELVTIHIASLPTLGDIFHFYETGQDTTSFLPAMLVHLFQRLPGRPEIILRLPSNIAYLVTCFCLWIFLRRKYTAGFASSAVFLLPQGLTLFFASEARAYAFVMMGTAIAMVCWQTANREDRWKRWATFGVFFGLAFAILFHFFAVFLFVPFAIAELYYERLTNRVRWNMWLALILYPTAILVMAPTMLIAKKTYGGTFWSKPSSGLVTECYSLFMQPIDRGIAGILLLIALLFWFRNRGTRPQLHLENTVAPGFNKAEWLLLIAITMVPVFAFAGSRFLGVFRSQYVLFFQLGMLLLIVGALAEILGRRNRDGWAFAGLMLLLLAVHVRPDLRQEINQFTGRAVTMTPADYQVSVLQFVQPIPLPVVVDAPLAMLPIYHYSTPDMQQRLFVLTDHQHSLEQPKAVTTELNMEIFGPTFHLPVRDYDQFVSTHRDFLLIVGPHWIEYAWLLQSLMKESQTQHDVQLQLLYATVPMDDQSQEVYRVHFGTASTGTTEIAETAH